MGEVVHVWWATTDDLTAADAELLDDAEHARRTRLQRAADRDRFVLGAALVRCLVAHLDGTDPDRVALDRTCARCGEQHGPVATPGRPWQCTVSHSGGYAVAAVSLAPVGVDVETGCPPEWRDLLPDVLARGRGRAVRRGRVPRAVGAQGGRPEGHPQGADPAHVVGRPRRARRARGARPRRPRCRRGPRRRRPQAGTGTRRRATPAAAARVSRHSGSQAVSARRNTLSSCLPRVRAPTTGMRAASTRPTIDFGTRFSVTCTSVPSPAGVST